MLPLPHSRMKAVSSLEGVGLIYVKAVLIDGIASSGNVGSHVQENHHYST
jgi:hypothetical protein